MATNKELDSKLVENAQPPMITFSLTINDANIVLAGLQELPHKVSNPVINAIVMQVQNATNPE